MESGRLVETKQWERREQNSGRQGNSGGE
jgi:hypothetical protein